MAHPKKSSTVSIAHTITHIPTGTKVICVSRKQTATRLQQIAQGLGQDEVSFINEDLIPLLASGLLKFDETNILSMLKIEIQDEQSIDAFVKGVIAHHLPDYSTDTDITDDTD